MSTDRFMPLAGNQQAAERVTRTTGATPRTLQIPVFKLVLGESSVDDGDVSSSNPMPVTPGAGENHIGQVGAPSDLVDLTFSLDTSAYASGDVLADTQELVGAVRVSGGRAVLQSLTLIDEDDQGVALTVIFFRSSVSLGTENSAPSISDANARECLGFVSIATTDYVDLGGVKIASLKNIGLVLEPTTGTSIYVALLNSTGTPTFTASGLKGRFGLLQD